MTRENFDTLSNGTVITYKTDITEIGRYYRWDGSNWFVKIGGPINTTNINKWIIGQYDKYHLVSEDEALLYLLES